MNAITDYSRATNAVGGSQARFDADIMAVAIRLSIVELVTDFGIVQVIPSLFLNRTSGAGLAAAGRNAGALIPADDTVSSQSSLPQSQFRIFLMLVAEVTDSSPGQSSPCV